MQDTTKTFKRNLFFLISEVQVLLLLTSLITGTNFVLIIRYIFSQNCKNISCRTGGTILTNMKPFTHDNKSFICSNKETYIEELQYILKNQWVKKYYDKTLETTQGK